MPISPESIEKRIADFIQACRGQGLKVTHQRIEIFREVASSEAHPDAGAIFKRVRKRIPAVGLDTVYRNLKFLSDRGLIKVMGLNQEHLRFDANLEQHHHFVCVKCGAICDFNSEEMNRLAVPEEARRFGSALAVQVEVKGVCGQCQSAPMD